LRHSCVRLDYELKRDPLADAMKPRASCTPSPESLEA
jgi:hypothetical protein